MKRLVTALVCLLLCLPCAGHGEDYLVSDTGSATSTSTRGIPMVTGNAVLNAAIGELNAGSLLDALNSFTKLGTKDGADKYTAYAQALLSLRRDDPASAVDTLKGIGGFLDSDYQLALAQALQTHRYSQDGKFGFVDATGTWKIAPAYSWAERVFHVESVPTHDVNAAAYQPQELYMVAKVFSGTTEIGETDTVPVEGKYGLLRNDGMLIVPMQYTDILWTVNGVAAVTDGKNAYLFDIVTGKPIGEAFEAVGMYANGYVTVQKNDLWGYINPKTAAYLGAGFVWESALPFSEGKAGVSQNDKYGYIDETGAVVIDLQYTDVGLFSEGLAGVRVQKRWGFINDIGTVVVQPGYSGVKTFQGSLCAVEKNNVWGLINTKGEVVLRLKYSEIGDFDPIYHRAWIRQNKLWGLVSNNATIVLKPTWGFHDEFNSNTLCRVAYQKMYGFVDANGKTRIVNSYPSASPFRANYAAVEEASGQIRYLSKAQRSFTVNTTVPVECQNGFIEGRTITETERAVTDPTGIAYSVFDRHITYALYDGEGNAITVPAYQ